MASIAQPAPARRLYELLKEEQEPFLLEVYLLEKGYSKRSCNSETRKKSWLVMSCKKLQKQRRSGSDSREEGIPKSSKHLNYLSEKGQRTQVAKLAQLSCCCRKRILNSFLDHYRGDSSSSCINSVCSCTTSYRPLKLCTLNEQAAAEGKLQWACMEDIKQLSPVSVLELPPDEGSFGPLQKIRSPRTSKGSPSNSNFNLPREVSEGSILSTSLSDLLMHYFVEKNILKILGSGSSSQYLKTKMVLQQTKQLLLDCAREVIESYESNSKSHIHEFLGPEMLGKVICDQIFSLVEQDGGVKNMTHLLESDLKESKHRWSHFQPHIKDIGVELGDAIFEKIIYEIVADMLDILL